MGSENTMPTSTSSPPVRILVVEDNRDAAFILSKVLQWHGYDVQVQHTGLEGVEAALSYQPHIAILDLGLPDIDGWQVARRLQEHLPTRPVLIALTGYGQEDYRRKSAETGFDHHLLKSISPNELLAVLQDTVQRRGFTAAS